MPSPLICPHCLHPIRIAGDGADVSGPCPACGKPPHAAPSWQPPARVNVRDDDDYDDDVYEDERPSRRISRRSRGRNKPGKVQAIAIMTLVGGIWACLVAAGWLGYIAIAGISTLGIGFLCCLWPGPYYTVTVGIMAIIKGSQLLGEKGHLQPPPKTIAIMMIIDIIDGDVVNCVLGILILVFCSDPEVESYYRG